MIDAAAFRSGFPVLERLTYLNAGTNGPVPARAIERASEALEAQLRGGRGDTAFFKRAVEDAEQLRTSVAALVGCEPAELALTHSTTDGVNVVLSALELRPGDEVLTSDEEHPGLLAPLAAHRERRGLRVRVAPFGSLADAVTPETRLVACSHVSWMTGQVVDSEALARSGTPVLLDGAQALGAVKVDVRALGCDFYAAAGQKWLCGPNGLGYLYVRRERIAELPAAWPGYGSLADPERPLELGLREDARRFDMGLPSPHDVAWALGALEVLQGAGIDPVHERAASLASSLSELLRESGRRVAPRGASTLVSWESADPEADTRRLGSEGVVVRNIPGRPLVRASVGAWNEERELERLVELTAGDAVTSESSR